MVDFDDPHYNCAKSPTAKTIRQSACDNRIEIREVSDWLFEKPREPEFLIYRRSQYSKHGRDIVYLVWLNQLAI